MSKVFRGVIATASGLLGVGLSLVCIKVDESLKLLPRFPSPGGEDDFSVRAAMFFGLVCPAFLVLGFALGWLGYRELRRAAMGWLGAIVGSAAAFLLASAVASARPLESRMSGNTIFLGFVLVWIAFAILAARLFSRSTGQEGRTGSGERGDS